MFCCVFKVSQRFQTLFWAVELSAAGPRASLYYVNGKVGNYKSNLNKIWPVIWGEHFENLAKIYLKLKHSINCLSIWQEGWCAVLPGQIKFSAKFIYWDTDLRWNQSSFQIGCHFLPPTEPFPWNVGTIVGCYRTALSREGVCVVCWMPKASRGFPQLGTFLVLVPRFDREFVPTSQGNGSVGGKNSTQFEMNFAFNEGLCLNK